MQTLRSVVLLGVVVTTPHTRTHPNTQHTLPRFAFFCQVCKVGAFLCAAARISREYQGRKIERGGGCPQGARVSVCLFGSCSAYLLSLHSAHTNELRLRSRS